MTHKLTKKEAVFQIILGVFMIGIFIIMVYPFLYIFNYSISSVGQIKNPLLLLPVGINFDSYKAVFADSAVWNALLVSVARSTLAPVCAIFFSGMAAFALSRKDLVCKRFFRLFVFLPMYFSAGVIPMYLLIKSLNLTNTFWVYIIPGLVAPFAMVLIRTYMESIPDAITEAANIDGANDLQTYWMVMFPVCKPVMAAVLLFEVIEHWNSFMATQLYNAMSPHLYTLQFVLYNTLSSSVSQSLQAAQDAADVAGPIMNSQSLKMAITVITVIPVMCIYPLLKKYFLSGIMVGSVKA